MLCARCNAEVGDLADVCDACGGDPLLHERYVLEEAVGYGAMGTTYRARRVDDGQIFAIKELLVRNVDVTKTMSLFEREASILETLEHPGIPRMFEDFVAGEGKQLGLYLVQEFIDGHDLSVEMKRRQYDESEVASMVAEVLDILAYLHTRSPPIVHRDIKPSNLMRRASDDSLVLVDFGSVRQIVQEQFAGGSTVTGTVGYVAPEQMAGRAIPASDIYGLGATAVALLSRRQPHELMGDDAAIAWRDKLSVSEPMGALLRDMLARDVADRATDAAALADRARHVVSLAKNGSLVRSSSAMQRRPDGVPDEFPVEYANKHLGANGMPIMVTVIVVTFVAMVSSGLLLLPGVSFVSGVLLVLAVVLGAGLVTHRLARRPRERMKNTFLQGNWAMGTVIQAYLVKTDVCHLEFEFEAGGRRIRKRNETYDISVTRLNRGDRIWVVYRQEDPEECLPWV